MLPFCFGPILGASCLRKKDTRLSVRYIFAFQESLGTRLSKMSNVGLEVKLIPSCFYLGDNEWRKVMIRFHTLIVVKVQPCTPSPKQVLHQSTIFLLRVLGVSDAGNGVLFPQLLEIIQIPLTVAKFTLLGCCSC